MQHFAGLRSSLRQWVDEEIHSLPWTSLQLVLHFQHQESFRESNDVALMSGRQQIRLAQALSLICTVSARSLAQVDSFRGSESNECLASLESALHHLDYLVSAGDA